MAIEYRADERVCQAGLTTMRKILPFLILIALFVGGCSWFSDTKEPTRDTTPETKKDETEDWTAEKLYSDAKKDLDSGYYSKAIELYEKLQARHPFGTFSQQAQLDLAYAYYKSDEPASAVAACERFIKLYPKQPHVDYAYYLKGLANFNQNKGLTERYLPIDPSQRDQGAAMKSFEDFSELVKRFPNSRYVEDARQRMIHLRNLLAQREVDIARYYMRRGAYVAAANRARYVVEHYQRAPIVPDALAVMAKAYRILELNELSDDALRVLELNDPKHPGIAEVKNLKLKD